MAKGMVSLRESIEEHERREALLGKSLECYSSAIDDVEKYIFRQYPTKFGMAPPSFAQERSQIRNGPACELLDETRQRLSNELADAAERLKTQMAGMVELRQVLSLIEQTTTSLTKQGEQRVSSFSDVASTLQVSMSLNSIDDFRNLLGVQVRNLRTLVDEMRQENRALVSELEKEMSTYRRKLDEAEKLAGTDPLTGLDNRRSFERRVRQLLDADQRFTLMILDLDHFRSINNQYGHIRGDEILQEFARRMQDVLRDGEHACRWGGDEFVILCLSPMRETVERSNDIEATLAGHYRLSGPGVSVVVRIGISIGLAEAHPGESASQIFARADALLYREKRKS
jgi:diguanylate cyclase